jgi:hypothetical protein
MLTIAALPKPFRGHIGVIQRNAITSWTRLSPKPEIILFGGEQGTAEIAKEMGLRNVPSVARSEFGTPLLNDVFEKAQVLATYGIICYINADILLLGEFTKAVQQVACRRDRFLMIGRRTNVDLSQLQDFESPDWEARLRGFVLQWGICGPPEAIDYFVFSRGLFVVIPPFAIGRLAWDNWLIWNARSSKIAVVDASAVVLAIHQNHDYFHHPQGKEGIWYGKEAERNHELAGERTFLTLEHATHRLTSNGIKWGVGHWFEPARRAVPPWWWTPFTVTRSIRRRLGLNKDHIVSLITKLTN